MRAGGRRIPLAVRLFAVVGVPLTLLYATVALGWYATAPEGRPQYGVNFSCKRAQHLNLDCEQTLRAVLGDLGARHVRISAYWSDIELQPGEYDFHAVDALLDVAHEYGARVTVSVGMRAQRYPEFWFPTWLRESAALPRGGYPEDNELVRAALMPYLSATAAHIGGHPAVEAIQVENEPFVPSYAYGTRWRIRPAFLAEEIDVVRRADNRRHPLVVSHASWLRRDGAWRWIVDHADVVAQSVYTKRQRGPWTWLYLFPYRLGPLTPDLPAQAAAAAREGKQLWIGELQAEPYEAPSVDVRRLTTAEAESFSEGWLRANAQLAARSGATRVYVWGVEWWAYLRERRGEPGLWEAGRTLFGASATDGQPAGRGR